MLQFLLLMLALGSLSPAAASRDFAGPDPRPGPTPVSDKDVLAWPAPQCADARQEQRAMEQRMKGLTEECVIRPRKRDNGALDQSRPHP
jgi:hypothetical protein